MPVAEGARGGHAGRAGVLGCWARWHGCARRGRRPECRDHGPAGDHGGPRGRARAWNAVIKDQFMITAPHAGDRSGRPARPGNPAVACTAATVLRLVRRSGRPGLRRVTPPVPQGRSRGRGWRCRVTASAGHGGGSPGVAYNDDGLLLLSWHLGIVGVPGRAGAQRKRPTDAVIRARAARAGAARPRRPPARAPARRTRCLAQTAVNLDPDPACSSTPAREGGFRQTLLTAAPPARRAGPRAPRLHSCGPWARALGWRGALAGWRARSRRGSRPAPTPVQQAERDNA